MKYPNIKEALFLERPNRFIAYAKLNNEIVTCHVKNTGRCRELLIPGETIVYLEDHGENTSRKTRYSLVKARKGTRLVNLDSQAPNQIVFDWMQSGGLFSDLTFLKREHKYGNSRFDIYYERENGRKGFVEVKGVKLLATSVEGVDMNGLRDLGDQLKEKLGEGVVVIASSANDKVNLIAMATDGAMKQGAHAGNLIKGIAALVGGGGGGRPNMAQAGGKNPAGIPDAVAKVAEVLGEQIK